MFSNNFTRTFPRDKRAHQFYLLQGAEYVAKLLVSYLIKLERINIEREGEN